MKKTILSALLLPIGLLQGCSDNKNQVVTDVAELRNITDTYRSNSDRPKDFIPQGNGTVIDKRTGLQWMRCAFGQNWTGATCEGQGKTINWDSANTVKMNFSGQSDWRLPNRFELETLIFCKSGKDDGRIVRYGQYSYWVNQCKEGSRHIAEQAFPNITVKSVPHYWSSSPLGKKGSWIGMVSFSNGSNAGEINAKDRKAYVLLVRSPKKI